MFTMILVLLSLVAAGQGAAGLGDPLFPSIGNGGYDVRHYDVVLAVDVEGNAIDGGTTIWATATQSLSRFNLDFYGHDIGALFVDEVPAGFRVEGSELIVEPAQPLERGREFRVRVTYQGVPRLAPDLPSIGLHGGWIHAEDEIFTLWSPKASAGWFPNNEHPKDKATARLHITVRHPYVAVCSGRLERIVEEGDSATYTWHLAEPVFTGTISLCIGRYTMETRTGHRGIEGRNFFPGQPSRRFDIASDIVGFYAELFGPFPYGTLGFTWVDRLPVVAYSSPGRIVCKTTSPRVIAHEIAHQWFGNSVSPAGAKDIWLVEGFATYASWIWSAHANGSRLDDLMDGLLARLGTRTITIGNPGAQELFDPAIYSRGALTLHALRLQIGDDIFEALVRSYTERYRHGCASTEEFVGLAEGLYGIDLDGFFASWLYQEAVPDLPPRSD